MVISLAAGLDARPYRMSLPETLQWIEVDLPGILEYKETILANEKPVCQLEKVKLDLSDRPGRVALFKQLAGRAGKALIFCEGLMIYLSEEEAGTLAADLSAQKNFLRWIFDLSSPGLLVMAQKEMGGALKDSNASFKFAPEEGEAFFQRFGWKPLESRSKLKTAATIKRLPEEMMSYAAIPEPWVLKVLFPGRGFVYLKI